MGGGKSTSFVEFGKIAVLKISNGDTCNRTYQAVVDYKFVLDTLGSRLQFKADYAHQRVGKLYDYTTLEYRMPTDETPFSTKRLHESYTPITAALEVRADLTKIFTPSRSLEAGLLYNYGQIDNNSVMTQLVGDQWQVDDNQSVWFLNRMQHAGAYATFSDAHGGFSYQAGLRFQWDQVAYKDAPQEAMTNREHGRWFPELSLAYTFNETKGTVLNLDVSSYSGDLPYGMEILPKRKRITEYSYSIGNPQLNPYRGFSLDLTYTLRGRWTFNYYFAKDQDIAKNFSFYDPEDPRVIYTKPMNSGTSYSHYLGMEVDTPITKWMRLSAYVSGKMGKDFYALGEEHYSTEHKSLEFHGTLIFEPIKTLRINVHGSYRTKQQWSPELWLNADYPFLPTSKNHFSKDDFWRLSPITVFCITMVSSQQR